jgi:hypothetical protein
VEVLVSGNGGQLVREGQVQAGQETQSPGIVGLNKKHVLPTDPYHFSDSFVRGAAMMEDSVRENDGIAVVGEVDVFGIYGNVACNVGQHGFVESASIENFQIVLAPAYDQDRLASVDIAQFQMPL